MKTEVKIIADSINNGNRITTVQLRYWRAIHGEVMTHRMFSRNAGSSRAIPVQKMLSQVWHTPAMPVHFGTNKPGMQAGEELAGWRRWAVKALWVLTARAVCVPVWVMSKLGLHKQIANRPLEPWQYINVVITATDWDNFFALRCHPDAQPDIQELACMIREAMQNSEPVELDAGEWHLPYIIPDDVLYLMSRGAGVSEKSANSFYCKLSVARCARVSYTPFDGAPNIEGDLRLFDKLTKADPPHLSPLEHQAVALEPTASGRTKTVANFKGWQSFRSVI
jgi:hypothetical protein